MSVVRHLVARQTVEIVAADRAEAEVFSARTSRAADRLAGAVERGLDAVEAAGLDLRIDRLELDLGPCDPARWEDALADGIRDTLAAKVAEMVDRGEAVHRHPAAAALSLLGEFARTGRLPWWAAPGDTPESAIAALASAGCDPEAVRAILQRSEAIERFVNQLEERALLSLLRLAMPEWDDDTAAAISIFVVGQSSRLPAEAGPGRAGGRAVWREILAEAALAGPTGPRGDTPSWYRLHDVESEFERFRAAVARRLGTDPGAVAEVDDPRTVRKTREADDPATSPPSTVPHEAPSSSLAERLRALAPRDRSAAALFVSLARLAPRLGIEAVRAVEALLDRSAGPPALPALIEVFVDAGAIRVDEAERWRDRVATARAHPGEDAHDAVAVVNSGLVLLWPFLAQFFESLGLLENEDFRDAAAQHRAVAVLHYLAGGEIVGPEQELPLAKVLAGVEIDAVHEPGEPLDAVETAAAAALLEAVLGHAPMLGRISVGGLRRAFLRRPGLLSTRDGQWLLRVERRSIDILLDRLPWTFAWVRLPWMAEPLQVEW